MGKSGRHQRKQGHHGGGKPGRGGGSGGKRRHSSGGWVTGLPTGGGSFNASDSDDGPATLHIGGVRVRVDSAGMGLAQQELPPQPSGGSGPRRQRRRSAPPPPPPALRNASAVGSGSGSSSSSSDSADEQGGRVSDQAMEDYLANLGAHLNAGRGEDADAGSGSSGSQADEEGRRGGSLGGSAAKRRRRAYQQYEVLRRFSTFDMEDEGPPEGLGWAGFSSDDGESESSSDGSGSSSSGDGDDSNEDDSGSSSDSGSSIGSEMGSSDGSDGDGDSDSSADDGELMEADLKLLSLAQRYPVQVRPRPAPLSGQQQQAKQAGGSSKKDKGKKKRKMKGAKGGKLAPGEKKRLKHEGMQAKRAARAAARGFDLPWINRQLEEFVQREGDMQAFGPFGKHEGKAVARLAALYGCRATQQGSKSNRKMVMVASTQRTCLPQGGDLLAVGQILAAQSAAERSGAARDGRLAAAVSGEDFSSLLPAALMAGGSGRGRWAGLKKSSGGSRREGRGAGAGGSGSKGKPKRNRSNLKPVAFVSVGAIDPEETVEVAMPAAAVAAAAADAAAAGGGSDVEMAVPAAPSQTAVAAAMRGSGEDESVQQAERTRQQQRQRTDAAAASLQLLEVVEDMGGSPPTAVPPAAAVPAASWQLLAAVENLGRLPPAAMEASADVARTAAEEGEADGDASDEASDEEEGHAGLGSAGTLYTRMTGLSLSPRTARGSAAAEGITNPGRLLGLGLALGIGPEVFGAPGPAESGRAGLGADLSPLSPLLSKSQLRKIQRRASGGGLTAGAGTSLAAAVAAGSSGGKQQNQQAGRKGKGGRSKAERRSRGDGAAALAAAVAAAGAGSSSSEDDRPPQDPWGQAEDAGGSGVGGLGLEPGSNGGQGGLVSGDYGYFEKHTTGIGSKLMAKWGFGGEGTGLGRSQQGLVEPLQAVRRAKKLGLGAMQ